MNDQRKTRALELATVSMETEPRKARPGLIGDFLEDRQVAEYPVEHGESGEPAGRENRGGPAGQTFQAKPIQPEIVLTFNSAAFQRGTEEVRKWQENPVRQPEQSQPKYEPTILSFTSIWADSRAEQGQAGSGSEIRYYEEWKPVRPKPTIKKTIREQAEIDLFREVYDMALQAVNAPFAYAVALGVYLVRCEQYAIEAILNALRKS